MPDPEWETECHVDEHLREAMPDKNAKVLEVLDEVRSEGAFTPRSDGPSPVDGCLLNTVAERMYEMEEMSVVDYPLMPVDEKYRH